jgi:hypothetical protein
LAAGRRALITAAVVVYITYWFMTLSFNKLKHAAVFQMQIAYA